jgi:hypothetical protein
MSRETNRRTFLKGSVLAPAAIALSSGAGETAAGNAANKPVTADNTLPRGKIGHLSVSRVLLGGNLLTHYTHSRDLQYVYNLTAHYNTEAKIIETMRLAEQHGINALSVHTVPRVLDILKKYRYELGGQIQWIICPTAPVEPGLAAYTDQVDELIHGGVDAIYLWGVHADKLVAEGKLDLVANAVEVVKERGMLSGVGAHDMKVVVECEKNKVDADFYIKTLHHHNYPSAPKPHELKGPYNEVPGYWCRDPKELIEFMEGVEKPWIAFKIMAAGAIPPKDAFGYAFENGADHILAGMFDFEIAEDVAIAKNVLDNVTRTRPWRT